MKRMILVLLGLCLWTFPALSAEIEGVTMPETFQAGDRTLVLNGVGLRKAMRIIKVYAGALYLPEKTGDPEAIIAQDAPMAVRLHLIVSGLNGSQWEGGWRESFTKANGEKAVAALQGRIDRFIAFFADGSRKNDCHDIVYIPAMGVQCFKNGELVGTVEGFDFKKALFTVWFGENPGDANLKDGMLGMEVKEKAPEAPMPRKVF